MTIVVTGAAGFIGSNILLALNAQEDLNGFKFIAVDDLTSGDKFLNLVDSNIEHYFDKRDFLDEIKTGKLNGKIKAILHQGACSDTMNHDGRYMLENNYQYTLELFDFCQREKIPFLYASSAAVYGGGSTFLCCAEYEKPLNVYGYSKLLFDRVLRKKIEQGLSAPAVGFRYFNVYGQHEQHKGRMASVAFHNFNQYHQTGKVRLFGAWQNCENGMQSRDFVSVEDVVKVNLFFLRRMLDKTHFPVDYTGKSLKTQENSGIFNLGTGKSQPFNDVACAVVNACRQAKAKANDKEESAISLDEMIAQNIVEYIDFPESLKGKYQSYTQADISALRHAGYTDKFLDVEEGVSRYVNRLLQSQLGLPCASLCL